MRESIIIITFVTLTRVFAQNQEYDWSKIFTTPDTSFLSMYEEVTTTTEDAGFALQPCGEGTDRGIHQCVRYFNCDAKTKTIIPSEEYDGTGQIDIRLGSSECEDYLDVCCKIPDNGVLPPEITTPSGEEGTTMAPVVPPVNKPQLCGIRNLNGVDFKITGNKDNEAEYGEFPWMLAILRKHYDPAKETLAVCGASLITLNVVLTGAHCVYSMKSSDIKIRAGEWDTQTERERYSFQERNVKEIIIHEKFASNNLFNDVALLILEKPFDVAPHIGTICLPEQGQIFNSKNCFASGWGKDVFGKKGKYQVILKKIELPIVPHGQCETLLRGTRLGPKFKLHSSFTCAGGEGGKDTCTGDGGSPLVCPDPKNPNRYVQAGIVAWGIGCGENNVPGVYAGVAYFRNWIDTHMQRLNFDTNPYKV